MADFAPEFQAREPQDYGRLSQGYRDDAVGQLFSGLGDTLKLGVAAIDEGYKRLVKDDARAKVDDIQNGTIDELQMHAGVGTPKMRIDRTPSELARFSERAKMFQAGVNAGNIKESSYWAMLDASSRQLRSRYPGYRDQIDDVMKEFTGQVPANALIRELRQDAEATLKKANDPNKIRYDLIKAASANGALSGQQAQQALLDPVAWPIDRLMGTYADKNKINADIAQRRASIGLAGEQGAFDLGEVHKTARAEWGNVVQQKLLNSNSVFSKTGKEINDLQTAMKGRQPSAQEIVKMQELADQQFRILDETWKGFITKPQGFLNQGSYSSTLKAEQLDTIRKQQLDFFKEEIKSSITDPQSGSIHRVSQYAKLFADASKAEKLSDPRLSDALSLRSILGDVAYGSYMLQTKQGDPGSFTEVQTAARDSVMARQARDGGKTSLGKEISSLKDVPEADKPKVIQSIIKSTIGMISDPNLPLATRKALVDSTYGDGNSLFLDLVKNNPKDGASPTARHDLFRQMANPAIAKQLLATAKETGDMSMWKQYEKWTINQVYALNLGDIATVSAAMTNAPLLNIRFDPVGMRFIAEDRPFDQRPGGLNSTQRGIGTVVENWRTGGIKEAVDKVNRSFEPLRDIARENKWDAETFASTVLGQMNLRRTEKYPTAPSDSLFAWLNTALGSKGGDIWAVEKFGPNSEAAKVGRGALGILESGAEWLKSQLPTRESVDRARNQANRRGDF